MADCRFRRRGGSLGDRSEGGFAHVWRLVGGRKRDVSGRERPRGAEHRRHPERYL